MTSENSDFDAGEFYDEGVADAGIDTDEVVDDSPQEQQTGVASQTKDSEDDEKSTEPKTEETDAGAVAAALESTKSEEEPEQEPDSVITDLLPKSEESEASPAATMVPLESHVKLRKRAQDAERKVTELQQELETPSTTPTGAVKPGTEDKSPLKTFVEENPDEDFIPASVQLAQTEWQDDKIAAKQQAQQTAREAAEAQQTELAAIQSTATKATTSEQAFRKATPDYDTVCKAALTANMLTDAEKLAAIDAENPAETLYQMCKAKADAYRVAMGIATPASGSQNQAPTGETEEVDDSEKTQEQLDDEIFSEYTGAIAEA